MTYTDLVNLMPGWAWLVVAAACVTVALALIGYWITDLFAYGLSWDWLIQDEPEDAWAYETLDDIWRLPEVSIYDQERDVA